MKKIVVSFQLVLGFFVLLGCGFLNDLIDIPIDNQNPVEDHQPGDQKPLPTYTLHVTSEDSLARLIVDPHLTEYDAGSVVTITALDYGEYRFSYWIDRQTGQRLGTANPLVLTLDSHRQIEAIYEVIEYFDITLTSNISSVPSVKGEAPYMSLMLYTLTAETVPGYRFDHWLDVDTGLIVSYQESYSFTLNRHREFKAVYTTEDTFGLYLYSNISQVSDFGFDERYQAGSELELSAPKIPGFIFNHWFNYRDQAIISESSTFTISIDQTYYLIAVYKEERAPRLYYEETFEETVKGTYEEGTLQAYGHQWLLSDALIGTLGNDQKNGLRSVRIRNEGSIEPLFSIDEIAKIEFSYGRYLGDNVNGLLDIFLSFNNDEWFLFDTLTTTEELLTYSLIIDADFYATHAIDSSTLISIRFVNAGASRTNFDDFKVYRNHYFVADLPTISAIGDDLTFPNNSTRVTLSFDDEFTWALSYQENWDGSGCIAIDEILGELECLIEGFVDTSTLGDYQVTYYVIDEDGRYASEVVTKVVFKDASLLAFQYSEYYQGIEGLFGEALIDALRLILNDGVSLQTYNSAREILADADVDPNDNDKVLTIYDRQSVERVWDATTWHREHVWPNSRLGIPRVTGSQRNVGSDLHNLRAIIPSINSSRSNKVFSGETSTDTYYPGDDDKGDVARILFYMVVMWEHLELVDELLLNDSNTNYTLEGAKMAFLSYLLRWHFEDPVDGFEVNRNDVIFSHQNNRNPFIDYPHLVELIWYDNPAILVD